MAWMTLHMPLDAHVFLLRWSVKGSTYNHNWA